MSVELLTLKVSYSLWKWVLSFLGQFDIWPFTASKPWSQLEDVWGIILSVVNFQLCTQISKHISRKTMVVVVYILMKRKSGRFLFVFKLLSKIKYLSFIHLIYHVFLQALFEGFRIMSRQILRTGIPGANTSIKWTILIFKTFMTWEI